MFALSMRTVIPSPRGGDGQQQCLARPDNLRAAGEVERLAERLAATMVGRQQPYRWTSHRPVAPPEGRASRRPGDRQAPNRACQFLDLSPYAARGLGACERTWMEVIRTGSAAGGEGPATAAARSRRP